VVEEDLVRLAREYQKQALVGWELRVRLCNPTADLMDPFRLPDDDRVTPVVNAGEAVLPIQSAEPMQGPLFDENQPGGFPVHPHGSFPQDLLILLLAVDDLAIQPRLKRATAKETVPDR
jgi:hypothetical protein